MVWSWPGGRFCLPKQSISLVVRPEDLPSWCRNSKMNRTKSRLLTLGHVSGNLSSPEQAISWEGGKFFPLTMITGKEGVNQSESMPRLFLGYYRGWFHATSPRGCCWSLYIHSPGSCQQNTSTKRPFGGFQLCSPCSTHNTKVLQEGPLHSNEVKLNLRHSMLLVMAGHSTFPGLLSWISSPAIWWPLTKCSHLKERIFQLPDSTMVSTSL